MSPTKNVEVVPYFQSPVVGVKDKLLLKSFNKAFNNRPMLGGLRYLLGQNVTELDILELYLGFRKRSVTFIGVDNLPCMFPQCVFRLFTLLQVRN